jgi:hypothetical protein
LESYGLKPFDGSFIHEFDIARSINIKNSTLKVVDSIAGDKEFTFRKDFFVNSPINFSGTYQIASVEMKELYELNEYKWDALMKRELHNKLVMINIHSSGDVRHATMALQTLVKDIKPRAIIFLDGWEIERTMPKHVQIDKLFTNSAIISMSKEAGEELLRMGEAKVEINVEADVINNSRGYNIFGYIPGTDESKKTEYVIIGSKIDFVGDDANIRYPGALEAGGVAAQLEIAKKLVQSGIKPKQNIMFAFWDGSFNEDRGSSYFIKKYVYPKIITDITYLDIGNLALKKENTVLMDTSRIFPKNKIAQQYINILKDNAREQGVKLAYGSVYSPIMVDLTSKNIQSMLINNSEKEQISTTADDTIEIIDKKRYKRIGQMLLDTIIEIARGK